MQAAITDISPKTSKRKELENLRRFSCLKNVSKNWKEQLLYMVQKVRKNHPRMHVSQDHVWDDSTSDHRKG